MEIGSYYSGQLNGYWVTLDGKEVHFSKDEFDRDLFIAGLMMIQSKINSLDLSNSIVQPKPIPLIEPKKGYFVKLIKIGRRVEAYTAGNRYKILSCYQSGVGYWVFRVHDDNGKYKSEIFSTSEYVIEDK